MQSPSRHHSIGDPPFARALFGETRWAWIWLIVRVYIGWAWLTEGIAKAQSPGWVGANAGSFLHGWISAALLKTQGAHPDVQGWYGAFLNAVVLPNTVFWSYLVTVGEIAVGAALILGLFTGVAAFFGTIMNASYLLAGTVSVNPMLFALASLVVLAWKTAGWWGLDRFVLPWIGTPWQTDTARDISAGQPAPAPLLR